MADPTAGVWAVNPVNAWVEVLGEDAPICAMLWPTDLRSEEETFANAQLITAAKDLLEAAHCALIITADAPDTAGKRIAEDMLRAAITKAGAA